MRAFFRLARPLGTTPRETARSHLETKTWAEVRASAQVLVSKWDRAVSRGVVPKGRANRKKARIAGALAKLAARPN